MKPAFWSAIASMFLVLCGHAHAGPVRDFESAFRDADADYRAVLFTTNSNDTAAAAKSMGSFEGKWTAIVSRWGSAPPPQYADDPAWPEMVRKTGAIIGNARAEIQAGKLAAAHEVLEQFRDEIGALHARNEVMTFSDRMNAYHEKMEKVLGDTYGGFDAPGRERLREDVAVLAYLAADLERHRRTEMAESGEFRALLGALQQSLSAIRNALAAGDAPALKKAVTGLKPAYSKFFLRFG